METLRKKLDIKHCFCIKKIGGGKFNIDKIYCYFTMPYERYCVIPKGYLHEETKIYRFTASEFNHHFVKISDVVWEKVT
jgi:hypothetical protein